MNENDDGFPVPSGKELKDFVEGHSTQLKGAIDLYASTIKSVQSSDPLKSPTHLAARRLFELVAGETSPLSPHGVVAPLKSGRRRLRKVKYELPDDTVWGSQSEKHVAIILVVAYCINIENPHLRLNGIPAPVPISHAEVEPEIHKDDQTEEPGKLALPHWEITAAVFKDKKVWLAWFSWAWRHRNCLSPKAESLPVTDQNEELTASDVILPSDCWIILKYLYDRPNQPHLQADIKAGVKRSRDIVGENLEILRLKGYSHRPHGERKGDAITEMGKRVYMATLNRR